MVANVCLPALSGHPILTPDGREIRLPQFAFAQLRMRGLLLKQRGRDGLLQMAPLVYELIGPEYDALMNGLRQLLGIDLTGPDWLVCNCRDCKQSAEDADRTPLPLSMYRN